MMKKLMLISSLVAMFISGSTLAIGNIEGGFGNNYWIHEGKNFVQDNTKVDVSTGVTTKVKEWNKWIK